MKEIIKNDTQKDNNLLFVGVFHYQNKYGSVFQKRDYFGKHENVIIEKVPYIERVGYQIEEFVLL